jgi:hypothetical protein
MEKEKITKSLIENFYYIQGKIDEIKKSKQIDIKQISDLHRYVEMQKNIVDSLCLLDY